MATEYKLSYTASEINRKLATVDETKSALESNYYTSAEVDDKIIEVSDNIGAQIDEVNSNLNTALETNLAKKADLVEGKVPVEQIPDGIVDLSGYYTKTEVDTETNAIKEDVDSKLSGKADLVDGKIPLEQLPEDIGGDVAWEDIQNKPFGEGGIVTVEFPTDISGSVTISSQSLEALGGLSFNYVKVGSQFSSAEEIIGAPISATANGQTHEFTVDSSHLMDVGNGFAVIYTGESVFLPACLNVTSVGTLILPLADAFGEDLVFNATETGLYFLYVDGMGQTNSIARKEIKKLDEKFIPDTIARKSDISTIDLSGKADLVNGKVPVEQLPDDIGSGVNSWNDLEDKPFGENNVTIELPTDVSESSTVSTQGLSALGGIAFTYVKVRSPFNSADEVIGAEVSATISGAPLDFAVDTSHIVDADNGFAILYSDFDNGIILPACINVTSVGVLTIPAVEIFGEDLIIDVTNEGSEGLYFICVEGMGQMNSITASIVNKIDIKYLPSNIGGGLTEVTWDDIKNKPFGETSWSAEWDGNPDNSLGSYLLEAAGITLYKISNETKTKEEVVGTTCKWISDGVESECVITIDDIVDTDSEDCFVLLSGDTGGLFIIALADGTYDFMGMSLVLSTGIWAIQTSNYTSTYLGGSKIQQIDPKYLPIELDGSINLANYYTKAEIDDIVGNCDSIINSINTLVGGGNV